RGRRWEPARGCEAPGREPSDAVLQDGPLSDRVAELVGGSSFPLSTSWRGGQGVRAKRGRRRGAACCAPTLGGPVYGRPVYRPEAEPRLEPRPVQLLALVQT